MRRPGRGGVALLVGAAVFLLLAPVVLNEFRLSLLTEVLLFGLFAASLDLLVGYTGMPSLGHAAYAGAGGYAAALVLTRATDVAIAAVLAGAAAGAVAAAVTGVLAVRTRGVALLMLTLAVVELGHTGVLVSAATGGANGLRGIPLPALVPGVPLADERAFYAWALLVAGAVFVFLVAVVRSPFGKSLLGVRANEPRMRAIGYDVRAVKLAAFTIAGGVAGAAGAMIVAHNRFVSPSSLSFELSALALIAVVVGGTGTLVGPVLGAAVVLLIRDELSSRVTHWELVLGVVFVLVVYLLPRGVVGGLGQMRRPRPRPTA